MITIWAFAVVVVVFFIGAIGFDLWQTVSVRRQVAAAADQAAQAGANALDQAAFRSEGIRRLDPDLAETLALEHLATDEAVGEMTGSVTADEASIVVEISGSVDLGLLKLFTTEDSIPIRVRAVGVIRQELP